ncbi:MAG: butyrate kinase [Deltaproteobacteria bacterium]|nr:butyrate kinase [Deltaproteobacteria bacterium]
MSRATEPRILVINPGGTSTKIAVYAPEREEFSIDIRHPRDELARFDSAVEQLDWRTEMVRQALRENGVGVDEIAAVVGRGAPLEPVPSGTFLIDEPMLRVIREGRVFVDHPSLLGPLMAHELAREADCSAYVVDPLCVDELDDAARLTGLPEIPRRALAHTLSVKAASRAAARDLARPLEELDLVVLHLGSGTTVAAQHHGRQVDANDASANGPMAPTRPGNLPALDLARLCFSGELSLEQVERRLVGGGGWFAHLGTDDIREIYRRVDQGEARARLVLDATLLQLSKEVGGLVSVLRGAVDGVVFTGGVARSERFVGELQNRLAWIGAPFFVYPGGNEMIAMARGALRVLDGEHTAISMAPYLGETEAKT